MLNIFQKQLSPIFLLRFPMLKILMMTTIGACTSLLLRYAFSPTRRLCISYLALGI